MIARQWLLVTASKGQFSDEFAVRGVDYKGEEFSFFAQDDFVHTEGDLNRGPARAYLRVEPLDQKGELVLIRLPGQIFGNGSTITVKEENLVDCGKEHQPA